MSYIAVGIGVAGLATSAYSAYDSSQKAKKQSAAMRDAAKNGVFGKRAEIPDYKPIDMTKEQMTAVTNNANSLKDVKSLVNNTNQIITNDAFRRAKKLLPGYKQSMKAYGQATGDMMRGQLPFEDVLGIVGNRAELANSIGVPGLSGNATLKDLGMSRMDAIKTGGGMMQDMVRIAETVSPRASYINPASQFVSPMDRIQIAQRENENVWTAKNNQAIAEAGGDPGGMAMLQARNNEIASAPNWGAVIGSGLQSGLGLYGAYTGASTGGWGGNTSPTGPRGSAYFNGSRVPAATKA